MRMTDWNEVDEIFQAARDVGGAAERTAWLAVRCAGRPDLHAEVASLLSAYDSSDAFLQPPNVSLVGVTESATHVGTQAQSRIHSFDTSGRELRAPNQANSASC